MSKTSAPKIYAVVPYAREDVRKYLTSCIEHLETFVDEVIAYDDYPGALMQHEGHFRSQMLSNVVKYFNPRDGVDWILVNDSDEFIATPAGVGLWEVFHSIVDGATYNEPVDSLLFGRDELWRLDPPMKRVDKTWGNITNFRMFRFRKGMPLRVRDERLASGSIPEWAERSSHDAQRSLRVVHAGYAIDKDREEKYKRYHGRDEHGEAHVESILNREVSLEPVPYCPVIRRTSEPTEVGLVQIEELPEFRDYPA